MCADTPSLNAPTSLLLLGTPFVVSADLLRFVVPPFVRGLSFHMRIHNITIAAIVHANSHPLVIPPRFPFFHDTSSCEIPSNVVRRATVER